MRGFLALIYGSALDHYRQLLNFLTLLPLEGPSWLVFELGPLNYSGLEMLSPYVSLSLRFSYSQQVFD